MLSDLHEIEQVLQTYFDGLYEGDTAKLGRAFHDVAHLFSVEDGKLADMSRDAMVRDGARPASRRRAGTCRGATGWCRSTARVRTPRSPRCSARFRRVISPTI